MSDKPKLTTVYKPNGKAVKVNDNSLKHIGSGDLEGWTKTKPAAKK